MEATSVYGIAAGGILIILIFVRFISFLLKFTSVVSIWIAAHFIYPYLLGRHRLIGPWTRVSVIGHLLYVAANLLALCFRPSTLAQATELEDYHCLILLSYLLAHLLGTLRI
ncbi:LOW QUALITY PROTEIN: metalloreductase transmembrane component, putative [Aspergillus udagawae]|uniref:Metalloreductase transmembrane component, putative n=1 Tax=Aspergillus udagawae TaxID=91492 RepID=A0A8H3S5L4_9EURO|nr:LOW QUALITY PROTEIN: metalloreductase transmembrane component, putative [Aspergillus udagawae]